MRKLVIEIDLGNDAFAEYPMAEVRRILENEVLDSHVLHETLPGKHDLCKVNLKDINGNTVGSFKIRD